jgi:hypothetical protein
MPRDASLSGTWTETTSRSAECVEVGQAPDGRRQCVVGDERVDHDLHAERLGDYSDTPGDPPNPTNPSTLPSAPMPSCAA